MASAPQDTRIYAVGDVHGRADLLADLLDRIVADAAGAAARRRLLVFLGDYVDRGPDSRGVMDILLAGPPPGFEAVHLRGNHEDLMLRFLDTGEGGDVWLFNGGDATLESYGLAEGGLMRLGLAPPGNMEDLRRRLAAALPEGHRAFLDRLVLAWSEGDYLFVHAGLRPGVPLAAQSAEDMMWIRGEFLHSADDFGQVVVHGHSIRPAPEVRPNRIGIDTGAYRSGVLTAAVLEGEAVRFLST